MTQDFAKRFNNLHTAILQIMLIVVEPLNLELFWKCISFDAGGLSD